MELDFQLEDLDEAEQMLVQVSFLQSNNLRAKLMCFFLICSSFSCPNLIIIS